MCHCFILIAISVHCIPAGRKKLGDYIRAQDYVNAKDDSSIHNNFIDYERECNSDESFSLDEVKVNFS